MLVIALIAKYLLIVWSVELSEAKSELFLNTADIIRLRGFKAEEYRVTTRDGYILQLVRATNPLIRSKNEDKKNPILFIHGILTTGNCFIINSDGVEPKDFSNFNASAMTIEDLVELLADEPSKNSLVFLALNFGREVWLLNRRGAPGSQMTVNGRNAWQDDIGATIDTRKLVSQLYDIEKNPNDLISVFLDSIQQITVQSSAAINSNFWNYSLDEQSFDVPDTIEYISNITGSNQVDIVGHSAGGALTLMALIVSPELDKKVSHAALWAPALNLGLTVDDTVRYIPFSFLRDYVGSIPPVQSVEAIQSLIVAVCQNSLLRNTLCSGIEALIFGRNGGQNKLKTEYFTSFLNSVSGKELAHLYQCSSKKMMHRFDYGNSVRNQLAYNLDRPARYDPTMIKSKNLAFWAGNTDALVAKESVEKTVQELVKCIYITQHPNIAILGLGNKMTD